MKILYIVLFVLLSNVVYSQYNVNSKDYTVYVKSELELGNDSKVTFTITPHRYASSYSIRRKEMGKEFTQQFMVVLDSLTFEYTDNTIKKGRIYEYEFRANILGPVKKDTNFKDLTAFNYLVINTGKSQPKKGVVLILVDDTMADPLSLEIDDLKEAMKTEGWGVIQRNVPRTEEYDGESVKLIKSIIVEENDALNENLGAIFILGRVAVPYSGNINPDGHPDHRGAWPADMYYGSFQENKWTDNMNLSSGDNIRKANWNVAGDGRFDLSQINFLIDVAVGRVDFYNMPAFEDSETELLRKYLIKDHKYRTNQINVEKRALMDDNFNFIEGFGASGYRNFDQLVGGENIDKVDWFTTLSTDTYLWAYGDGGGSNTSAGGIGNTTDFASNNVNAVFTMLFGSYFGDWDTQNNFLRAGLASEPSILTCSWSARPPWYYQHMSLGLPISYSTLLSQNNGYDYLSNLVTNKNNQFLTYINGIRQVHISLMGDPTLTMHQTEETESINNLVATVIGKQIVKLTWDPPVTDDIYFYNLYRANGNGKSFKKIYNGVLESEEFIDENSPLGGVIYMVRPVRLVYTNSGLIEVEARGKSVEMIITSVEEKELENEIKVFPTPTTDYVNISIINKELTYTMVTITDLQGNIVYSFNKNELSLGNRTIKWDLINNNGNRVSKGVYFVNILSGNHRLVKSISVIK